MQRKCSLVIALFLAGALLSGCKHDNDASQSTSSHDLKGNSGSKDTFETSGDPPINANTRYAAGQLAEAQGQNDRALAQYQEALKVDPKFQNACFAIARMQMAQGKFPEAQAAWQQYIKLTNGAPEAYNDSAYCYEAAGQLDKAEETYKTAIAKDPVHSPCRVNYGLMLARHDRIDDAVAQLSTALKPAEVSYNLGSVFYQRGMMAQAKAYYQDALNKDPNLTDARKALNAMK